MRLLRISAFVLAAAGCFIACPAGAQEFPDNVADDPAMEAVIGKIAANAKVKAMVDELAGEQNADERFETMLYLLRIASPSREEWYRAEAVSKLFQEYINRYKDGDPESAANNARVVTLDAGGNYANRIEGAGLQIVDGYEVYNACMEIKGTYGGKGYKHPVTGADVRPKVLFEGHTDSVNPAHLDGYPKGYPKGAKTLMPVYYQSVNNKVPDTRDELAGLPELKFLDTGWPDKTDPAYIKAKKRYGSQDEAKADGAYRLLVPSIGDMMLQTANVVKTAELMLKHNIRPVYDLWICGSAGEEGRGNLSGMKQLYGYSQEGVIVNGQTVDKGEGNNALNFVANISTEGGVTIHYLGSHRYQMAYTGAGGDKSEAGEIPNPAVAAAAAVSCIAKLNTPDKDPALRTKYEGLTGSDMKTTYTAAMVYADDVKTYREGYIPTDVSIEIDMRSNDSANVEIMDRQIQECFAYGRDHVNGAFALKGDEEAAVKMERRWYGDRPSYVLNAEQMATAPILKAISYAHAKALEVFPGAGAIEPLNGNGKLQLTTPSSASSVNSNVPAKIKVPTVNINYGSNAGTGNGHSFNEYGTPGASVPDTQVMARAIYSLYALSGLAEENVEPPYGPVGSRTTERQFE